MNLSTCSVLLVGTLLVGCTIHQDLLTGGDEDTSGTKPGPAGASSTTGDPGGSTTDAAPTTGVLLTTGGADPSASVGSTSDGGLSSTGADTCNFFCETTSPPTCAEIPGLGEGLTSRCSLCDVFAQDCARDEKCLAWADDGGGAWTSTTCGPIGDKLPGEACTAENGALGGRDDCIKGAMCWDVGADNVGTCVALCTGSPEAPVCDDPATQCAITNDGVLNLCLPSCDPLTQGCPEGELCVQVGDPFVCLGDHAPAAAPVNAPCERDVDCAAGLACLAASAATSACAPDAGDCCQPFCTFPGGACPNPDQVCMQWYDPETLPANDPRLAIGVCALPG